MLDLGLKINFGYFQLGKYIDGQLIKDAELRKLGFFGRFLLKKNKGDTIYWSKNCLIECFQGNISIIPRIDPNFGPKMHGTSAFIYTQKNLIYKIVFQVIDNLHMASAELKNFNERCIEFLGEPFSENGDNLIWQDEDSSIISERSANGKNCYIYWLLL